MGLLLLYIGLLFDPSKSFRLLEEGMKTHKTEYYPGDEINVKLHYCSKKDQEVLANFYLIDSVAVNGEIKPILMRGPGFHYEDGYTEACEILWTTAFYVRNIDYETKYRIKAVLTYRVNAVKTDRVVLESNSFWIHNELKNIYDNFEPGQGPL